MSDGAKSLYARLARSFTPMGANFRTARYYCVGVYLLASLVFAAGIGLAIYFDDPEYFNRSGGMVTSLSLVLVLLQFRFEQKHKREEDRSQSAAQQIAELRQYPQDIASRIADGAYRAAEDRIDRTRYAILSSSVLIGIGGEVVHSVGDLAFEAVRSLIQQGRF